MGRTIDELQALHEQRQAEDSDHDRCGCVCCCWDCDDLESEVFEAMFWLSTRVESQILLLRVPADLTPDFVASIGLS
jgi:hypothetical protein